MPLTNPTGSPSASGQAALPAQLRVGSKVEVHPKTGKCPDSS